MYEVEKLYAFPKISELYDNPNVESANWKIETFDITWPKDFRAILYDGIPCGKYVRLLCKKPEKFGMSQSCMMSDTPMECFTNQKFLNTAHGDILIAGLGIGMLPAALAEKENVTSITIIELEQEVIDLVEPLIRKYVKHQNKIKIVQGDANTYPKEQNDKTYDFVYLDIWDYFPGNTEDLPMLEAMITKYKPICPKGKITTWGYEFAKTGRNDNPVLTNAYGAYVDNM